MAVFWRFDLKSPLVPPLGAREVGFEVVEKIGIFCLGCMALVVVFVFALDISGLSVQAQATPASLPTVSTSQLPNAPTPTQSSPARQTAAHQVGLFPFPPPRFALLAAPLNLDQKFQFFVEPVLGPRALLTTGFRSGIAMAHPPAHYPHEWHSGAQAYGRIYGDQFVRAASEGFAQFSTSALLHEDARYRPSESRAAALRFAHALAFSFVDKTDGGRTTLAVSNFAGAAADGFVGNAYLPEGFNNLTHAGQRSAIAFAGIAGGNIGQEFAPELARFLTKLHVPHIPLPAVWWTADR